MIRLSPQMKSILGLLSQEALEYKEIAKRIDTSETVVQQQVMRLCRRIGAKNRTAAIVMAAKNPSLYAQR
jgi:DNA-binding CsgD family transcriptional regulator